MADSNQLASTTTEMSGAQGSRDAVPLSDLPPKVANTGNSDPAATSSSSTSPNNPTNTTATVSATTDPVSNMSANKDAEADKAEKPTAETVEQNTTADAPEESAPDAAPATDPAPPAPAAPTSSDDKASSTAQPQQASTTEAAAPSSPTPPKADADDAMAIGPSVDHVQPVNPSGQSDGLACNITLLLTTGARHPYRIDERYLAKRNVNVPGVTDDGKRDPFSISVYTLKELILREWRDEWDARPASPSSIRLIHFGKLLDDKDQLKQYHFSAESANVVHMTVRPADIAEEEEPKGGSKAGGRRGSQGGRGGCCTIL